MIELTEKLTFTVPLSASDFRVAEQFSNHVQPPDKARQIFLNTLAVRAVDFYCQCLKIETNLEPSSSWDLNSRILMDVADLEVKNLGKLECRPILPGEEICHIPSEVWTDRIGYVLVEIDEKTKKAILLGFVERVDKENFPINQLRSLEDLIDLLLPTPPSPTSISKNERETELVDIKERLERLFAKDWDEPEKVLASSSQQFAFRNSTRSPKKLQSSTSQIKVNKAKSIKLKDRECALIVKITSEGDEKIEILLEVRPLGEINSLPSGLEIALIAPSGKVLKTNKAGETDNFIRLEFSMQLDKLELSRQFKKLLKFKITLEDDSHTENFPSD